jgi:membrane-bound serine protease (ClpP class)
MYQRSIILGLLSVALLGVGQPRLAMGKESEDQPVVLRAVLDDQTINPGTARFIERAIREAEQAKARCLILELDTPGGLVSSTRHIVKAMRASQVPIVVYIAPEGARAASAGVFITLAAHVTAMAPGTNIGAAHPVSVGGIPGLPSPQPDKDKDKKDKEDQEDKKAGSGSVMEEKILNDTVAWVRALAQRSGRDADWAERTVRESESTTAEDAHKLGVADILAPDLDSLLEQLDGRKVTIGKETLTLHVKNAEVRTVEMSWGEQTLALLGNPNVAVLLFVFGFLGILFELYSPGWGVSGTLGVICLILAFASLSVLPFNYAGLALIVVALGMFVAEVKVTSYGMLTLGGIVCLVLGGMMLVDAPTGFQSVSLGILIPLALATAGISVFLLGGIIKAHAKKVQTGGEALLGKGAVALEPFLLEGDSYVGQVRTNGETWRAVSKIPIHSGEVLEIEDRLGLTLLVRTPTPENGSPVPTVSTTDYTKDRGP